MLMALDNHILTINFWNKIQIELGEAAMSGGMKQDLDSLPRNWTWVTRMKTMNPSHQTSKH